MVCGGIDADTCPQSAVVTSLRSEGKPVRFGVVGLGNMGRRHCQIINATPGASLAGVCDHDIKTAEAVAAELAVPNFAEYDSLLASDDIDAIVICLPSSMHGDFGIRAAHSGKHVVVEKPIDSQSIEGIKLVDACAAAGVKCAVISQNRYSPGLASLKRAIESGVMGQPVLARATVKWFRHDAYYTKSHWRGRKTGEHGGVLMNQAVHSIDTLQWLFGIPTEVTGYSNCSRPDVLETEDTAVAIFRWSCGLLATLEASTSAAPGFEEAYEVHSPIASMKVTKGEITYWHHVDGVPPPEPSLTPAGEGLDPKLQLFARQYMNIIQAISGDADLEVKPREAIAVVQTIEKIYCS